MQKRNERSPIFKKKVALAALKEDATMNEIAKLFAVHPVQVRVWKKELQDQAEVIFERKSPGIDFREKEAALHEEIGKLTVENSWLKKKLGL